jgi:branched-subunit amino acid aminotransferase/4-amino-4-deoxychorismate lyase
MMQIFNGRMLAATSGPAEPDDAAGVFETLRLRAGEPQFWDEHICRFEAGCGYYGLCQAPNSPTLRKAAEELVAVNGIAEGVVRWSAWRNGDGSGTNWQVALTPPRPHMTKHCWSASVSPVPLPLPGSDTKHKHLGRRLWQEALRAARARGFDEALLVNGEGWLVEGAISNVFCVENGVIRTPALACGPLPGITRAQVIRLAREAGVPIAEEPLRPADAGAADELFLTNALVGIRPLIALDGVPKPGPGPVTARLQAAWRNRFGWI